MANKRGYLDDNFTIKKLSEPQGKGVRQHLCKDDSLGFKFEVASYDRKQSSMAAMQCEVVADICELMTSLEQKKRTIGRLG